MLKNLITILLMATFLSACGTIGQRAIVSAPADVRVDFTRTGTGGTGPNLYDPSKSQNGVETQQVSLSANDQQRESLVSQQCTDHERFFGVGAIAGFAVKELVSFLIDAIDEALQKELKKFAQAFSGSTYDKFYTSGSATNIGHKCVRITRTYKERETKKELVAMDFVAALEVGHPAALKIQPLRLYYKKAQALTSKSGAYGISVSLTIDAIWRAKNSPKYKEKVVDQVIVVDRIILKPNAYVYRTYVDLGDYQADAKKAPVYVPLIPWSHYRDAGKDVEEATHVKATMTVSEAGNAPWWLKKGADLFHNNKDKVNEKMRAAIAQVLKEKANIEISN